MSEKLPKSIEKLAENNLERLRSLGINRDELIGNFDKIQNAGETYLEKEFSDNKIDSSPDGITNRNDSFEDVELEKRALVAEILKKDPGVIVVRPELLHLTDKICDFLSKNGYQIDYVATKIINVKEYFDLYKEVIRNTPHMKPELPSRTLTYTNSDSSIITFTDKLHRLDSTGLKTADFFSQEYKGREGVYKKDTLRGDVVFKEALRLGFDTLEDKVLAQAVDPFGAYAELIKLRDGDWYHLRTEPHLFALMYNAQGIHCPNSKEIARDISTLYSKQQLEDILNIIKK